MVSAISSAAFAGYAAGLPAGNPQVQLDRYKIQLADWVNCPSCNTPEGKAKIAEISARIREIEAQMKSADDAKRGNGTAVTDSNILAREKTLTVASAGESTAAKSSVSSLPAGTLGSRLDIFA